MKPLTSVFFLYNSAEDCRSILEDMAAIELTGLSHLLQTKSQQLGKFSSIGLRRLTKLVLEFIRGCTNRRWNWAGSRRVGRASNLLLGFPQVLCKNGYMIFDWAFSPCDFCILVHSFVQFWLYSLLIQTRRNRLEIPHLLVEFFFC